MKKLLLVLTVAGLAFSPALVSSAQAAGKHGSVGKHHPHSKHHAKKHHHKHHHKAA
jgi:hypothetical protein